MLRQVTAKELIEWAATHYSRPFPIPDEDILYDMEAEGITFEIHTAENGGEYPHINAKNWSPNVETR